MNVFQDYIHAITNPSMCGPITYNEQAAPITAMMNMSCRYARKLHSCMRMIDPTCRYFTLNFRCNGSAGWVAAASGISHILPRAGGRHGCLTGDGDDGRMRARVVSDTDHEPRVTSKGIACNRAPMLFALACYYR